jgi:hypothetical protein
MLSIEKHSSLLIPNIVDEIKKVYKIVTTSDVDFWLEQDARPEGIANLLEHSTFRWKYQWLVL